MYASAKRDRQTYAYIAVLGSAMFTTMYAAILAIHDAAQIQMYAGYGFCKALVFDVSKVNFFQSFLVDVKIAPKCPFSGVLIDFYLGGGTEKNLKIKIYPLVLKRCSLESSHWEDYNARVAIATLFSLAYPLFGVPLNLLILWRCFILCYKKL